MAKKKQWKKTKWRKIGLAHSPTEEFEDAFHDARESIYNVTEAVDGMCIVGIVAGLRFLTRVLHEEIQQWEEIDSMTS